MAQQLPYQLVGAWIGVEDDFGRQMAELVRGDFHPEIPQDGLLDRDRNRVLGSRPACRGDEHRIGTLADHRRGNLVAIDLQAFGEHRRDLELEYDVILGFVAPERRGAPACGAPVASANAARSCREARFCMRSGNVEEKVDRKGRLQVDERTAATSPDHAALRARACPEAESKSASSRGSSNLRNRALFFSVKPDGSVPSLLRRALRVAITSAGAFTHSEAIAISVTATPWV